MNTNKASGKPFERLTSEIYAEFTRDDPNSTVKHDVQLEGIDGPRQIDILIRSKVAMHELTTIVECRDHARNLDVTAVDGLHSKLLDVNASKAILVARKGFSKGAYRKADRLNIDLVIAAEGTSDLSKLARRLPVVVEEYIVAVTTSATVEVKTDSQFTVLIDEFIEAQIDYGGPAGIDTFRQAALRGEVCLPRKGRYDWNYTPNEFCPVPGVSTESVQARLIAVNYQYKLDEIRYFVGHIDQFKSAKALINKLNENAMILLDSEEFYSTYKEFQKFGSTSELPFNDWEKFRIPALKLRPTGIPKLEFRDWKD